MTEGNVATVRDFFALFATAPAVKLLDDGIIDIADAGCSIGEDNGYYVLYGPEGDEVQRDRRLMNIVGSAVEGYLHELMRRKDDELVTAAQAEDYKNEVFMLKKAYQEGKSLCFGPAVNPYPKGTKFYEEWNRGYEGM